MQCALLNFFMERHNNREIPLQVVHENMTSPLVVYDETNSTKRLDYLFT